MNSLSTPFYPTKPKPTAEQTDEVFNHMRAQLDFLCQSAEYQNAVLKTLYDFFSGKESQCQNDSE